MLRLLGAVLVVGGAGALGLLAAQKLRRRVENLRAMGLTVPDTVDLLDRLRRDGLDVPLDALTVDACADAICAALR